MARQLWNVRCRGHRRDGQPCGCWALRGQFVCRIHGGATRAARAAAQDRLEMAKLDRKIALIWERGLARMEALEERRRADPEGYRREITGWLRSLRETA